MRRVVIALLAGLSVLPVHSFIGRAWPVAATLVAQTPVPARPPDVIYVGTPPDVVDAMLKSVKVGPTDVVYDLGCGDGRIVITAAKQYGARGVGIDLDPQRIKEARANALQAGVSDRVRFIEGDLFDASISDATVVALYLIPSVNLRLQPKFMRELKPGTRVVSHAFGIGDWKPDEELNVNGRRVFRFTVPTP